MSCILVGLSTLKIDPDTMNLSDVIWCVSRDFCLIAWHSALVIMATQQQNKTCTTQSNVFSWLLFDIGVSVLRLVKNPLQFQANKVLNRNGSNWSNPQDYSNNWVSYFSPNYVFCQMRMYTVVDWMTYLSWILGAWAIHLVNGCRDNFIVNAGYYEISFSTIFYVASIVMYVLSFGLHRLSNGRCLPGFSIQNSNWPDSCPAIHFDRTQWRQAGESLEEYRARVVEAFSQQDQILAQPMPMSQMVVEDIRLRPDELNQLKTLRYVPSAHTLNSAQSSESMGHMKDTQSVEPKDASRESYEATPILQNPSILAIDPQVPTQLLSSPSQENIKTTDDTCALCLEDYQVNEVLRELRCGHRYHSNCVDEWLTHTKRTCPVCNADAVTNPSN